MREKIKKQRDQRPSSLCRNTLIEKDSHLMTGPDLF